jgi:peptidoglycan-N-acetylglucosamine deacetylase
LRLCAVSVDLDEIGLYRALHGLPAVTAGAHAVYDVALARALELARAHRAPLTLFAVGRDLDRAESAERLAASASVVENHSQNHRYDLARLPPEAIAREIGEASARIADVTGRRPAGFRAPGYALSDAVLAAVAAEGLAFDASLLPSPAYYAAKLAAMGLVALRGRTSAAVLGDPALLFAPRHPHRRGGVVEIPMAVTRRARVPVIGTTLVLGGARLVRGLRRDAVVSLELHGADFLDARDGLADLAAHQLDLRIAHEKKARALSAALAELASAGYRFVTLEEVASRWSTPRSARAYHAARAHSKA